MAPGGKSSELSEVSGAAAAAVGNGPANVRGSAMKGSAAVMAAFVARFTNIPFLKSSTVGTCFRRSTVILTQSNRDRADSKGLPKPWPG